MSRRRLIRTLKPICFDFFLAGLYAMRAFSFFVRWCFSWTRVASKKKTCMGQTRLFLVFETLVVEGEPPWIVELFILWFSFFGEFMKPLGGLCVDDSLQMADLFFTHHFCEEKEEEEKDRAERSRLALGLWFHWTPKRSSSKSRLGYLLYVTGAESKIERELELKARLFGLFCSISTESRVPVAPVVPLCFHQWFHQAVEGLKTVHFFIGIGGRWGASDFDPLVFFFSCFLFS